MRNFVLLLVASALLLSHCATARSVHAWRSGDIFILSGTSYNSRIIEEKDCARFSERFLAVLDFPFSAVGDVLLLAATVPLQAIDFLTRIGAILRHEKPYPFFERERYRLATEQGENELLCKAKFSPAF